MTCVKHGDNVYVVKVESPTTLIPTTLKPTTLIPTTIPECIHGEFKCISECECGVGFLQCVWGVWKEMSLPPGTICYQNGTNIIKEMSCKESGSQGGCEGLVKGDCKCKRTYEENVITSPIPTEVVCKNNTSRCVESCSCKNTEIEVCNEGKWSKSYMSFNLERNSQSICVEEDEEAKIYEIGIINEKGLCKDKFLLNCFSKGIILNEEMEDGDYECKEECKLGGSYLKRKNSIIYEENIKHDEICYKNARGGIEIVSKSVNEIESKCKEVTKSLKLENNCVNGERVCLSECECGKGYMECVNGLWVERKSDNKVCYQDGINIKLLNSCNSSECINSKYSDCGCEIKECEDGLKVCEKENECSCGSSYKICENGRWKDKKLKDDEICYQSGSIVNIEDGWSSEYCKNQKESEYNCKSEIYCEENEVEECISENEKGKGYRKCISHSWKTISIDENKYCINKNSKEISLISKPDEDANPECIEGNKECIDNGYKYCEEGKWINVITDAECLSGSNSINLRLK